MDVVSKYLLIAAGVVILILSVLVYHYKLVAADYQVQIANIAAGADVVAEKEAVKQNLVNQTVLVNKQQEQIKDLQKQLEDINEIRLAPDKDDAPVAPVLSHTLDGLRHPASSH